MPSPSAARLPSIPSHYRGVLHRAPNVLTANSGEATVLLDLGRGQYYTLNAVGRRIWDLLGEHITLDALLTRILSEYDVQRDEALRDVLDMLAHLDKASLLRTTSR
jgi:hypothetical protein